MTTNSVNATFLDTTATQGHIDIVNLLLETDASLPRIARNNGKTVLHSAARMGHLEVVTALFNMDPGIGFRTDKKGQTSLHMASNGQNAEILLELLKPDVTVIHVEDSKGNIPLHVATRKGNTIHPLAMGIHHLHIEERCQEFRYGQKRRNWVIILLCMSRCV